MAPRTVGESADAPRLEWNCNRPARCDEPPAISSTNQPLICPTGCSAQIVSSPFRKNILVFRIPKSVLYSCRSVPHEGRFAIVTNAGRNAVDAAASGVRRDRRADLSSVSDVGHARRTALMRTTKACGPDASTPASSLSGGVLSPTGRTRHLPQGDGDKKARSPGRARYKP
jgi:hypothetical protein